MGLVRELRRSILQRLRGGGDPLEGFFAPEDVKESILAILVAGRHLLLEGPPGTGKTTAARIIAGMLPPMRVVEGCRYNCDPADPRCPHCRNEKSLKAVTLPGGKRFVRVQGSPELMPEDLVGEIDLTAAIEYGINDPRAFTPGKVQKAHRKILFIDELNRVPERTQNTLLQVLEEGVTTIAGFDMEVNVDTLVIATINSAESAGAERLSDTLRDRFEMVKIGYPTKEQEIAILKAYGRRLEDVDVPEEVIEKAVDIVRTSRAREDVDSSLSVRTTLSIFEQSQAIAKLRDRDLVASEDLEKAARIALMGRMTLS
ncbi:MAG: AAA family ATPase, partial [Candidatus Bathyarchaeia archaeon]